MAFLPATFLLVLGVAISCLSLADACKFAFKDPCENVTCPTGLTCQSDSSYYCDARLGGICPPVAVCVKDAAVGPNDPCEVARCKGGSTCVKVKNNCIDNQPCKFKAQCNANKRRGACPRPENNSHVTSCSNTCEDSDHLCEKGFKCCAVKIMGTKKSYCVPVLD